MNVKRYAYIALILLVILSVSAVSAADDQTNDIISADDNEELILDETIDEDVSSANNNYDDELILEDNDDELISSENEEPLSGPDDGTFQALQNKVNAGSDSTIILENDYECEDGFNSAGIQIATSTKNLTIDGKGHKIDAKGKARIFRINWYCENVVFKNITFLNGATSDGGAIYFDDEGKGCMVSNCTFVNNYAGGSGGAIYVRNFYDINISDCYFVNNTAHIFGGGIYMYTRNHVGNVYNCTFENNRAEDKGGAITTWWWAMVESYSCISKTSSDDTFNVINHPPTLDVNNITAPYDTGEKVKLNLTTYDGIQLTGINITINIYYKNNDSWVAKYECLSGDEWQVILPAGAYIAKFSTEYTGFDQSISITMTDTTELTATEVTTTYNVNKDLEVTLKDSQGNPLSGLDITVDLNGAKNYTTDSNGQIKVHTKDLAVGTYTAEINFTGTEVYGESSTSATVTVNRDTPELTATDVTTIYNVNKDLEITLKDSQGNPLSDMEISVDLNGAETFTTDSNGQINVSTKDLAVGTYTAEISFAGNENYTESSTSVTVTVDRDTPVLTATDVTTIYNVNKDLEVTLKDSQGNPLSDMEITVDLNGVKSYTTDSNGQIEVPTKGLNGGTYTAKIIFAGNENYTESNTTAKVTINKVSTKLTTSAVTTTYNVAKNLVITLKDSAGKALSGMQIVAKLGSTTKKAKTDKNGQVKINVAKLVPKSYTAKISFAGDANYKAASTTAKVTVKKINTKIAAKAKTFKYEDKTKKYTITLKDNKNKVLKNKKVTLKVNGKTYTAKTNSKGVATFKLNKLTKKGKFTAAITYAGDKYYNKANKKAKVTVKAPAWKTVAKGSKDKTTVKKIQQALKDNGYYLSYKGHYLKIDGIYKGHTERSVKEFQKDKGLKVTGKVDEKTAKKLKLI